VRLLPSVVCLLASLLLTGCLGGSDGPGRKYGKVSGTVSFKGQPVKEGEVNYLSSDTGGAAHATIKDGKFDVSGDVIIGKYAVSVTPPGPGAPEPGKTPKPAEAADIPEKYRDFKTSGLTAEVKEGSNPHEFKLE